MNGPFTLEGKLILITGASSGIGRQTAICCARHGATIIASGRNPERLTETLRVLGGAPHQAVVCDLTDMEQLRSLVDATPPIDGMFFSAGVAAIAPFRLISEKHLRSILAIDLEAPVLLTQRLLQKHRINKGASLVFNTAGAAETSPMATAIYSAAKAGLKAASRSLALEVAKSGMRVSCLQLGYVQTEMLTALNQFGMDPATLGSEAPLGMGKVEDAADAAVFLLSDASRAISRASLVVDGGGSLIAGI